MGEWDGRVCFWGDLLGAHAPLVAGFFVKGLTCNNSGEFFLQSLASLDCARCMTFLLGLPCRAGGGCFLEMLLRDFRLMHGFSFGTGV